MVSENRMMDEWDSPVETTDWKNVRETELVRKAEKALYKRFSEHMSEVRENIASLLYIEQSILEGDIEAAREAFNELDDSVKIKLNLAPTKGGWFSRDERETLMGRR